MGTASSGSGSASAGFGHMVQGWTQAAAATHLEQAVDSVQLKAAAAD